MTMNKSTLKTLKKITFEKCGTWMWCSGEKELFTEPIREFLKHKGFRFSGKKKAWYLAPGGPSKKRKGFFKDMEEVREKFGSSNISVAVNS